MSGHLVVESLCKDYPTPRGPLSVLRDLSLRLERGQSASIMGPSGCGKSTFLNIVGALEPPTRGRVAMDGVDPFGLSEPELAAFRNRTIGFVFQDHHLLPHCSALENVLIPTMAGGASEDGDAMNRARELLGRVGLADRADHLPADLSGGERQRVAVARALVLRPTVVLADEPTGNLDRATADAVIDLLLELHREQGAILIVVTHSATMAARCERVLELVDGAFRRADS